MQRRGQIPSELESLEGWEELVIEHATKARRIVTADLKAITNLVAGTALSLNISDRCLYPKAESRI